jgi:hypothetical protein
LKKKSPQPKRNSRKTIRVVLGITAAWLSLTCFSSCSSLTTRTVTVLSESQTVQFTASLLRRQEEFPDFRGLGKLNIRDSGTPKRMRVAWIGSQSGKLRMEMLGPWGRPLATFLVKRPVFYLYVVKDNICYQGKTAGRSLSRILSVPLRDEDLFAFLSGQPSLPEFHKAKVQMRQGDGRPIMTLYGRWNRIIQKMWFMDDGKTVERIETFDGFGDVKYTVFFSEFEQHGQYRVPYRIQISKAAGDTDLLLRMETFEVGISAPGGAFDLDLSDAEIVVLDS